MAILADSRRNAGEVDVHSRVQTRALSTATWGNLGDGRVISLVILRASAARRVPCPAAASSTGDDRINWALLFSVFHPARLGVPPGRFCTLRNQIALIARRNCGSRQSWDVAVEPSRCSRPFFSAASCGLAGRSTIALDAEFFSLLRELMAMWSRPPPMSHRIIIAPPCAGAAYCPQQVYAESMSRRPNVASSTTSRPYRLPVFRQRHATTTGPRSSGSTRSTVASHLQSAKPTWGS